MNYSEKQGKQILTRASKRLMARITKTTKEKEKTHKGNWSTRIKFLVANTGKMHHKHSHRIEMYFYFFSFERAQAPGFNNIEKPTSLYCAYVMRMIIKYYGFTFCINVKLYFIDFKIRKSCFRTPQREIFGLRIKIKLTI